MNSLPRRQGGSGIIRPFDDGYLGYDPRLPSQRFYAFSTFSPSEDADPSFDRLPPASSDSSPKTSLSTTTPGLRKRRWQHPPFPRRLRLLLVSGPFGMPQANGTSYGAENGVIFTSDGLALPDPDEMHRGRRVSDAGTSDV